jgi:alkylhydroperoxidase/carboxymuconolactone decarboxylase family protein YurZ
MDATNEPHPEKLPELFREFVRRFPALADAHRQIAQTVERSGPLDAKTLELVKIGISIGARLERATGSHVRRALQNGASLDEIQQVVLLAYNTCGWPQTVTAWGWVKEQLETEGLTGGTVGA